MKHPCGMRETYYCHTFILRYHVNKLLNKIEKLIMPIPFYAFIYKIIRLIFGINKENE